MSNTSLNINNTKQNSGNNIASCAEDKENWNYLLLSLTHFWRNLINFSLIIFPKLKPWQFLNNSSCDLLTSA
jgi:hypothetical protein